MATQLPLFIQPAELEAVLDHDDVQVVAVADAAPHSQSRIPGALHIQLRDFVAANPPVSGLLPDAETLTTKLVAAGLRDDRHIVVYDLGSGTQAARLVYTLLAVGHDAASLLDGGLNAWLDDGFELETGLFAPPEPGQFEVQWHYDFIADHNWIGAHLEDDDVQVIDVRSAEEFSGVDVRSARGGHVPGAIHFDWRHLLQNNGRLKPEAELRSVLAEHDIVADKDAVLYCQTHMRSSYALLVLKLLGFTRTRGYPGAWSDWGNRDDTPVAT